MSSNVRMHVEFNPVSKASSYLPSLCGSVRPPAPQEFLLLVFLRLLVFENRLRLVHVMHSGAGVASLVYFTRAIKDC